jgi:hypothetical protein
VFSERSPHSGNRNTLDLMVEALPTHAAQNSQADSTLCINLPIREPALLSGDAFWHNRTSRSPHKVSIAAKAGPDREWLPTTGRVPTGTPPTRRNPSITGILLARPEGLEPQPSDP